jgi:serine/threonine protein kinase
MSFQPGQILDGKYRIIRELGTGSMGAVYEGENALIKRRVAIKVLLPAVAERRDVVERFEREAQAAGRIGSDHIVEVLDLGSLPDGGFYMVMEFLEGETLGQRIRKRGRLEPRVVAPLIQQLAMGLEMAHDARIIHRDLKPENVFLMRDGQFDFVKILDFGVSKFNPLNTDDGMSMTRTGTVVGTPYYMAPEQAKGARDIDGRSDIYSVGVIMFEAVTGQVPFHAGTFNELIFKIVLETPPPPEQFVPDLDQGFARIIRRAMSREPADRYANAAQLRDALSLWLHTGKDTVSPTSLRAPPIGSNIDWDLEKRTILTDESRAAGGTCIIAPDQGRGGGTALIAPQEPELDGKTNVIVNDVEEGRQTVSRRPPPARVAAPPRAAPPAPPKTAPIPAMPAAMPVPAMPSSAAAIPAAVAMPSYGLPAGAPTPVNRRAPPSLEDPWPTGVPKNRIGPLPIAIGAVTTLCIGAIAAFVLLYPGSGLNAGPAVAAPEPARPASDKGTEVASNDGVVAAGDVPKRDEPKTQPTSEPQPEEPQPIESSAVAPKEQPAAAPAQPPASPVSPTPRVRPPAPPTPPSPAPPPPTSKKPRPIAKTL